MTADGWIPFDLEVARREPERVRYVDGKNVRFDNVQCDAHSDGIFLRSNGSVSFWRPDGIAALLRLVQPAAQEWNQCPHGVERPDYCELCATARGWHPMDEWRYPAAGPSDAATINAGTEHGGQNGLAMASQEAPAGEHAPAPAPLCNCGGANDRGEHGVCCNITLGIIKADQWGAAVGSDVAADEKPSSRSAGPGIDRPQSAPHPYRSRNGYGLRIREADERERERVLPAVSFNAFKEWK